MTEQYTYCMIAKCMVPVQLLLECIVLVTVDSTLCTTVITLTITDERTVVGTVLIVAYVQFSLYGESEVVQELQVHVGRTLEGITETLVFVQLVLPDDVTVLILVTGKNRIAVLVSI